LTGFQPSLLPSVISFAAPAQLDPAAFTLPQCLNPAALDCRSGTRKTVPKLHRDPGDAFASPAANIAEVPGNGLQVLSHELV